MINHICTMTLENKDNFIVATQDELDFINHHMPKGMVAMIMKRTGKSRSQVIYQLTQAPAKQDEEIINAAREILYAVTRKRYND